jgi:hypothetical protein
MASRLYVDMDGVLVDFMKGAEQYFHVSITTIAPKDFTALWEGPKGWRQLMKDWPTFWMDLDVNAGFSQLWKIVRPHHPAILTAIPTGWPSSAVGKRIWCTRHLQNWGHHPDEEFHAVDRPQKRQFARQADGTPNLLIDDFDKNIAEWKSAGGLGLLYRPNSIANIVSAIAKYMP